MGRTRKRSEYVIVDSMPLCSIGPERVFDPDMDFENSLADQLDCPVADAVLVALRKIFALTFSENPYIDGPEKAVLEIRRIGVEALIEVPQILEELKLGPIPRPLRDAGKSRVQVFRYFFVRDDALKIQVRFEGKMRSLHRLIDKWPGDVLVATLRFIVSETFSEIFDEEQAEEALLRIRSNIWKVLPAFNEILIDIDVEPMPTFIEQVEGPE